MNEAPDSPLPPPSPPPNPVGSGCLFLLSAFTGFIISLGSGFYVLDRFSNTPRSEPTLHIWAGAAFVIAILLCLKRGFRGFGLGILLGMGLLLLLWSFCGHLAEGFR